MLHLHSQLRIFSLIRNHTEDKQELQAIKRLLSTVLQENNEKWTISAQQDEEKEEAGVIPEPEQG